MKQLDLKKTKEEEVAGGDLLSSLDSPAAKMASRKGAGLDAGVVERMGVRWTKIAKASRVIPHGGKGEGAGVVGGEAKAYTFRIFELSKVAVPKFILDKGMTSGGQQKVQVHLTATLFDTEKKKFFGSTWAGKRLDMAKCCKASNDQVKWNGQEAAKACNIELGPDYGFSFCSAANLENVRLAVEIVMTEVDPTGSIRGQEYSICWTAMKLSAKRDLEKFVYARAAEGELMTGTPIYFGTPRVLMYVGADPKLLSKAKVEKAEARHILMTHLKLEEAAKALMVQDELVDGLDLWCVPGLNDQARIMDSAGAKVAASCPIALHSLTVDAGDGLEARLEEYIKVSSGQSFNFKELCVEVGVHNGRRFIGSEGLHKFAMSKSGSKWTVKEQIKLDGYIPNNAIAVVILVHAVGSMKDDDDTRVCIGWLPVVAVEAAGDKGPIVTGDYSTSLLSQAPMPCVSHALVYSEGDVRPKLTMTLKNVGGGFAEVPMSKKVSEAKALREAAAAAAIEEGEWESDDEPAPSERSKVASHKGTASASGKASSAAPSDADLAETASAAAPAPGGRAPILEPAQAAAAAAPAHKAVVNSKGELTEFTLACNTSALPGESKGIVEVDALEMDMNLKDILKVIYPRPLPHPQPLFSMILSCLVFSYLVLKRPGCYRRGLILTCVVLCLHNRSLRRSSGARSPFATLPLTSQATQCRRSRSTPRPSSTHSRILSKTISEASKCTMAVWRWRSTPPTRLRQPRLSLLRRRAAPLPRRRQPPPRPLH